MRARSLLGCSDSCCACSGVSGGLDAAAEFDGSCSVSLAPAPDEGGHANARLPSPDLVGDDRSIEFIGLASGSNPTAALSAQQDVIRKHQQKIRIQGTQEQLELTKELLPPEFAVVRAAFLLLSLPRLLRRPVFRPFEHELLEIRGRAHVDGRLLQLVLQRAIAWGSDVLNIVRKTMICCKPPALSSSAMISMPCGLLPLSHWI